VLVGVNILRNSSGDETWVWKSCSAGNKKCVGVSAMTSCVKKNGWRVVIRRVADAVLREQR
jgi:hypothetical protein